MEVDTNSLIETTEKWLEEGGLGISRGIVLTAALDLFKKEKEKEAKNLKPFDIAEFRDYIENKCSDLYDIGIAIGNFMERFDEPTQNDLMNILDIVRRKLCRVTTKYDDINRRINACSTPEELTQLSLDTNFGEYNSIGIPISNMIADKLSELYDKKYRDLEIGWLGRFFRKIGLFYKDGK